MRTADPALIALLGSGREFIWAELYTIVLKNGVVLNYNSSDRDIRLGGVTYSSSGALFFREQMKTGLGVQVDNLDITILIETENPPIAFGSVTLLQACTMGLMEDSSIILQRLFMPNWGDYSIPPLLLWVGNVGDATPSRSQIALSCVSAVEKLTVTLPRNLIQPSCGNTLFDHTCALDPAAFVENLSVVAGGNNLVIPSGSAKANTWYPQGKITWLAGNNVGLTFSIGNYAGGVFVLNVAPPLPIQVGDTFSALPGCDKLQATCLTKFNNLIHIRAFPYVPVPETAS